MIEYFLGSLILAVFYYQSNKIIYADEHAPIFKTILAIFTLTILSFVLNLYATEMITILIKIIMTYILFCMFSIYVYNKNIYETILPSFMIYLFIFMSEVLVAVLLSIFIKIVNFNSMEIFKNTVFINLAIYGVAYIGIIIAGNRLKLLIKNIKVNQKSNILISIIIIITVALLGIKIPLIKWSFSIDFIITMLILFFCCIIGMLLVKQKSIISEKTSMYQQVVKYSNTTNKVLEDYRMINHEHKNQLSIIRQMVDKENSELIEYIDSLIDKRNDIKYKWVSELNKLPSEGLKGLINYKLLEMEDKKISTTVIISKDISKLKLNKLSTKQSDHLYSIVGVYLDNAIQAAQESKKKQLSIEIYKDAKDLVLIIANTYKGKVNLSKIDNYGYTTKGKNHGIGLHIVRKILDEDKLFSQSRKLLNEYYTQELRIHTSELKNKKSKK